jgi:hypothetical protein
MATVSELLSPRDAEIIKQCLRATVEGSFFPDWEFHTLFGLERNEVRAVHDMWPAETPDTWLAVINSLNNLLGYPHGSDDELRRYVSDDRQELRELLDRLVALDPPLPNDR